MSNVINLDLKKEHSKKTLYWILRYIIKHHKHYGDVGYIPTSWLALSKFLNYKTTSQLRNVYGRQIFEGLCQSY